MGFREHVFVPPCGSHVGGSPKGLQQGRGGGEACINHCSWLFEGTKKIELCDVKCLGVPNAARNWMPFEWHNSKEVSHTNLGYIRDA